MVNAIATLQDTSPKETHLQPVTYLGRLWTILSPQNIRIKLIVLSVLILLGTCACTQSDLTTPTPQMELRQYSSDQASKVNYTQFWENRFGSSFLQLDETDPRDGVLIVEATVDPNRYGGFTQSDQYLKGLDQHYDVQYKAVESFQQICSAIRFATKTLKGLVISAHGTVDRIWLRPNHDLFGSSILTTPDCFDNLNGPIILIACSTGANIPNQPNFATELAVRAERHVIAPKIPIATQCVEIGNPDLMHTKFKSPRFAEDAIGSCPYDSVDVTAVFDPQNLHHKAHLPVHVFDAGVSQDLLENLGLPLSSWKELNECLRNQANGQIPKSGELFDIEGVKIIIYESDEEGIKKVKVKPYFSNTVSRRYKVDWTEKEEVF